MKIAVSLALTLALAPLAAAGGGGDDPTAKVVSTTLERIRHTPDAYKNVWVKFTVQFASVGKIKNPFFTEFVPSRFTNFYCWGDNQQIWKKDEYKDVFGLLFMAKGNEQVESLYVAKTYDRMIVTGVVRNTFQDEPWIEVTSFAPAPAQVNTATLSHMFRGESYMGKRQWSKAISELSLAPGDNLPTHVLGHIHKHLATCYLRLGESSTAIEHINNAVSMLGEVDEETRAMARLAVDDPARYLDRTLTDTQIGDHERPMWEAFEPRQGSTPAAPEPVR